MKIEVDKNGNMLLKEVFCAVGFETEKREHFSICMRDSGFEFLYNGVWYEAKNGIIKSLK